MKIDRVFVGGLFNRFDYDMSFVDDNQIMLLTGPNGSGKTTILKLIDILFNQSFHRLNSVFFHELKICFDDERELVIENHSTKSLNDEPLPLKLTLTTNGMINDVFEPSTIKIDSDEVSTSLIEDLIPELRRVGNRQWFNEETESLIDTEDVLINFRNHFPNDIQQGVYSIPDWFNQIKESITVRLIDTERLTRNSPNGNWRLPYAKTTTDAVTYYSKLLSERIQAFISEYATLSQSLDGSFPSRVIANQKTYNGSIESLRKDLEEIDQKRHQLDKAGLIFKDQYESPVNHLNEADEAQRNILSVYTRDVKKKLAIFDEIYQKISVFKEIVNSRFSLKDITVNHDGFFVSQNGDGPINLTMLSSGEQHELILLYELLFRATKDSLILIDEPEFSLHVAWQRKWLEDLERISNLSQIRAIVATHSPQIIADSWHLVVELIDKSRRN